MPYTPPAYNAVVFDFGGAYSPPPAGAVVFNFGGSGPGPGPATPQLPTGLRQVFIAEEEWLALPRRRFSPVAAELVAVPARRCGRFAWELPEDEAWRAPYGMKRRYAAVTVTVYYRRAAQIIG